MVTTQPTTTGINPMEFIIPALDDYVDLGRSYFTMELRLKKSDNGNLVANEKLWPVNNLAHSIIKPIDLQLNGTLISPQSDTYHYKAYLENLLNFDREDGKTVLGPQGWFNQVDFPPQWTANNTNSTTPHQHYRDLSANHKAALATSIAEVNKYAGGVTHSLVFTPHLEVFHTGKVLVPGVEIKMKFHFNSPNLFLNGVTLASRLMEGDVKLRFHLCQLRLNETVYRNLSVQRHNGKQMATYPTVRSEIRTFSMQGNLTRFDIPNLFQNRVPDRLIVALVDSRNFNGDVTRDPFCFQKFGLSSIRQIEKDTLMKPCAWRTIMPPEIIWDTSVFCKPVEPGAKRKAIWWNWEIGATRKIVPCSCLTMWPMDVLTVKDSTPSKRVTHNSAWNLELLPIPI